MATLLIVHHTPSPNCQALFEAVVSGATAPEIEGVRVVRRAALSATASDVLEADGCLLGTPANLGYMSGALSTSSTRSTTRAWTRRAAGRSATGCTAATM